MKKKVKKEISDDFLKSHSKYYRFTENLKHFVIRVDVKKASSAIRSHILDGDLEKDISENVLFENYHISWLQKLFNEDELKKYAEKRDFGSELENQYHSMAINQIDADSKTDSKHGYNIFTVLKEDLILKNMSKEILKLVEPGSENQEMMHIFLESPELNEPTLLCKINVNLKRNLLIIAPGFNTDSTPYKIHTRTDLASPSLSYTIQNASTTLTWREQHQHIKIMKMLKQMNLSQNSFLSFRELARNHEFDYNIFGEIVSAHNFDGNNLYIEYFLSVPENCDLQSPCYGLTQKTYLNNYGDAYFCSPFEFDFTIQSDHEWESEKLILYFRVGSIDFWRKDTTEGYGFIYLPLEPNIYSENVETWKLTTDDPVEKLHEYFLGYSFDFENLEFHQNKGDTTYNKFYIKTESSGMVKLNLNVIRINKLGKKKTESEFSINHRTTQEAMVRNIGDVVLAFKRARQNMLNLRRELKK